MSSPGNRQVDVFIAGAGFAGLSLAVALRQALGASFAVVVADPALERGGSDPRASAIVAAARRLFETIGVWEAIAPGAQPILDMAVTDSRLDAAMRPTFLTFDGEVEVSHDAGGVHLPAREPFAHMIENGPLLAALLAKAKAEGVELMNAAVADCDAATGHINIRLQSGASLGARLLVAADGARSSIRERAGIATHGWDYGQSSIVTTVSFLMEIPGAGDVAPLGSEVEAAYALAPNDIQSSTANLDAGALNVNPGDFVSVSIERLSMRCSSFSSLSSGSRS